jgi:NAD(P)-dependent dehydrogenase (short-subunit alcohol dehydrogenase family)
MYWRHREADMRLKDKVAVVTGGAMGIGQATAERFAREGARVVIVDKAEKEGKETESLLAARRCDCRFMIGDVTRESNWQSLMKTLENRFGRIDILFNNAGTNLVKEAPDVS